MKNPNHGVRLWLMATMYVSLASMALAGPIHDAAKSGDIQKVRDLLSQGVNVNDELDESGASALYWAAIKGQKEIAELLIQKGARVDQKNGLGDTPLAGAVALGQTDIVELLLSKGAAVDERGKDERTPLFTAVNRNKSAIAKMLIASGASIDAKNRDGNTSLYQAAGRNILDLATLLLIRGADPNARNKDGDTPLHVAAAYGNKDIVELLLSKGANPQAQNNSGKTPPDLAEQQGHLDILGILDASIKFIPYQSDSCGFRLSLPESWPVLSESEIDTIYQLGGSGPGGPPCFAAWAPTGGTLAGFASPALPSAADTFLTDPEEGLREQYAEFVGKLPRSFVRTSEEFTTIDDVTAMIVVWRMPIQDTILIQKQLCLIKNGKAYLLSAVSNEAEFPTWDSAVFQPVFRSFHVLP